MDSMAICSWRYDVRLYDYAGYCRISEQQQDRKIRGEFWGFLKHFLIPKAWQECLVFPVLIIVCMVAAAVKKQGKKYVEILLLIFCIAYFIPLTGSVMNGFSYSIDRWSYMIYFLMAVLAADICNSGVKFSRKILLFSAGIIAGLLMIHLLFSEKNAALVLREVAYIGIAVIILFLLENKIKKFQGYRGIFTAAVLSVCINGIFINGPVVLGGDGYSAGFESNKNIYGKIEASIADGKQGEDGFYRIDAYDASLGGALVLDFCSATQYFSITNDNTYQFYKQMSISPGIRSALHILKGLDSRAVLESILSVRYYQDMVSDGSGNFEPLLIENENVLPFGYLYHGTIAKDEFDKMNEFQKMDTITQRIITDNGSRDTGGIEFSSAYFGELTTDINIGNKNIQVRRKDDSYYIGTDDFLIHTAVPESRILEISFTEECELKIGDIGIYWYPLEVAVENLEMKENQISGWIQLDAEAWLFLSVPYSKGWSAWIDGEKTELQKANIGFMALELSPGMHEIVLKYSAPGSRVGLLMSIAGWIIFGVTVIWSKNRK